MNQAVPKVFATVLILMAAAEGGGPSTLPEDGYLYRDALISGLPAGKVYEHGAIRKKAQARNGIFEIECESSTLSFVVDGFTGLNYTRSYTDKLNQVWKESFTGTLGKNRVTITFEPNYDRVHFVDFAYSIGQPAPSLSQELAAEFKRKFPTELGAFDYVTSLERADIRQGSAADANLKLQLFEAFTLPLVKGSDNLTRWEGKGVVVFVSQIKSGDTQMLRGRIFSAREGNWLADLVVLIGPPSESFDDRTENLIARITKAFDMK